MRESHQTPIPFHSIVCLEDTSPFRNFFIGRISHVVMHYDNVLIVSIASVTHDPNDPYPCPHVQLILPLGIIRLPDSAHFMRWIKQCTIHLDTYYPPTSASIWRVLEDLKKEAEGAESFEIGRQSEGGEILVRSSQDHRLDELLSQVRNLGPLPPL
jgi:hypothetical protein